MNNSELCFMSPPPICIMTCLTFSNIIKIINQRLHISRTQWQNNSNGAQRVFRYTMISCEIIPRVNAIKYLKCKQLSHFPNVGGYQMDFSPVTADVLVAKQGRTINHLCCSLNSDDIWRVWSSRWCGTMLQKKHQIWLGGGGGGHLYPVAFMLSIKHL